MVPLHHIQSGTIPSMLPSLLGPERLYSLHDSLSPRVPERLLTTVGDAVLLPFQSVLHLLIPFVLDLWGLHGGLRAGITVQNSENHDKTGDSRQKGVPHRGYTLGM